MMVADFPIMTDSEEVRLHRVSCNMDDATDMEDMPSTGTSSSSLESNEDSLISTSSCNISSDNSSGAGKNTTRCLAPRDVRTVVAKRAAELMNKAGEQQMQIMSAVETTNQRQMVVERTGLALEQAIQVGADQVRRKKNNNDDGYGDDGGIMIAVITSPCSLFIDCKQLPLR